VTHDQVEALSLADRVAVLDQGRIVQEGAPADIYERPKTLFVARFLGARERACGLASRSATARVGSGLRSMAVGHRLTTRRGAGAGARVHVVLRPEDLTLSALAPRMNATPFRVRIAAWRSRAAAWNTEVDIGGSTLLRVLARPQADLTRGKRRYGSASIRAALRSSAVPTGRRRWIVFEWERIDPQFLARILAHCGRRARWRNRR
jgi:ABC-type Fe3+/spermidine/putrescine transport system ATPase subunit